MCHPAGSVCISNTICMCVDWIKSMTGIQRKHILALIFQLALCLLQNPFEARVVCPSLFFDKMNFVLVWWLDFGLSPCTGEHNAPFEVNGLVYDPVKLALH